MAAARKRAISQKLPHNLSLDADQQKRFEKDIRNVKSKVVDISDGSGVIYVGHIPHGFFEPQMKKYFKQFGRVVNLRLSRSKKTGGSKGYAFIEFASHSVAQIVAETMDNYLMFHRLLKCKLLTEDKVHPEMFMKTRFQKPKVLALTKQRHNRKPTVKASIKAVGKSRSKKQKTMKKLKDLGIEYELPQPKSPLKVKTAEGDDDDNNAMVPSKRMRLREGDSPKTPSPVKTAEGDDDVNKAMVSSKKRRLSEGDSSKTQSPVTTTPRRKSTRNK